MPGGHATSTEEVITQHGQSDRCEFADATTTTTTFTAFNPSGNHVANKDGEPVIETGDAVRRQGAAGNQPCP